MKMIKFKCVLSHVWFSIAVLRNTGTDPLEKQLDLASRRKFVLPSVKYVDD